MSVILSIIIVILLIVIYYLYNKNRTQHDEITVEREIEEDPQIDQSIESTYYVLDDIKVTKKVAIEIVNAATRRTELSKENTNFSKLNKAKPVWWFNIPPIKFSEDLHLILKKGEGFIWITIPKGVVKDVYTTFRIREINNKDFVDIEITSEIGVYYLRDVKSGGTGFNFEQYIKKEFD